MIEKKLVALVQEFKSLQGASDEESSIRQDIIREHIELIGETAAFYGGFRGMIDLHDAAEELVGCDNSIGYHLNEMWAGIGRWLP